MRSVWKSDFPPAVRVDTKNVREHPEPQVGSDGREGFDIAGVKPSTLLHSPSARLNWLQRDSIWVYDESGRDLTGRGKTPAELQQVSGHDFSRAVE